MTSNQQQQQQQERHKQQAIESLHHMYACDAAWSSMKSSNTID